MGRYGKGGNCAASPTKPCRTAPGALVREVAAVLLRRNRLESFLPRCPVTPYSLRSKFVHEATYLAGSPHLLNSNAPVGVSFLALRQRLPRQARVEVDHVATRHHE